MHISENYGVWSREKELTFFIQVKKLQKEFLEFVMMELSLRQLGGELDLITEAFIVGRV